MKIDILWGNSLILHAVEHEMTRIAPGNGRGGRDDSHVVGMIVCGIGTLVVDHSLLRLGLRATAFRPGTSFE